MANTIKIKQSAMPSRVPTTGDLILGELGINTYDGKLYAKKDNGTASIIEIGASSAATALPVTLFSGSVVNVSISNGSLPVLLFGGSTVNITVT